MQPHLADSYTDTGSVLHTADARAKVVAAVGLILLIGLAPVGAFGAYVGFFALIMAGALAARVDPLTVVRRSLVAVPFALAALTLIFTVPGPVLARLPLTGWPVTEPGVVRFASILFKSVLSVQVAALHRGGVGAGPAARPQGAHGDHLLYVPLHFRAGRGGAAAHPRA